MNQNYYDKKVPIKDFILSEAKAAEAKGETLAEYRANEQLDADRRHRQSRVINRDYVRKWALDYAKTNRSHPFERVSERFLNRMESATKNFIAEAINRHPSKGKTLL